MFPRLMQDDLVSLAVANVRVTLKYGFCTLIITTEPLGLATEFLEKRPRFRMFPRIWRKEGR
jgi:hypothetical protein